MGTSRQLLLKAALEAVFSQGVCTGEHLRNLSFQFPYQVFRSALFPASPPPGCSQCGVLCSCLPSHPFLLLGGIFFFFFLQSTLRRLLVFSKALQGFVGVFCRQVILFSDKVPVLLKTIISGCLCTAPAFNHPGSLSHAICTPNI